MVPTLNHRAWRELIVGKNPIASSRFGFNLLLTNNRLYYRKDQSEAHLDVLIHQIHEYLSKYESLYQAELKQIFGEDHIPIFRH